MESDAVDLASFKEGKGDSGGLEGDGGDGKLPGGASGGAPLTESCLQL